MESTRPLYIFFGHHKCATGWINSILRETCFHMGWRFEIVHRPVDWQPYPSLAAFVAARRPDILAFTNADIDHLDGLSPYRGFHVVRDPRDMLVSGYFSHLHSHPTEGWPELAAYRDRLAAANKEEGLLMEMDFSAPFFDHMNRWEYDQDHVLELRMEDLTASPLDGFRRIYQHFGFWREEPDTGFMRWWRKAVMRINITHQRGRRFMPFKMHPSPFRFPLGYLTEERLQNVVARKSFSKLAKGRRKGEENVKSHYRKGKSGDWVNHFTPEHRQAFHARYQSLLLKLGYAADASWVAEPAPVASR